MATTISLRRRRLLQGAGVVATFGAAALPAARAAAAPASVLSAATFAEALAALGGTPLPSAAITLDLPAIADNGAVVPVTVTSTLPGTREIVLLVDTNPQPVALQATIPLGTEPFVATRIRMAASGTVHAVLRTDAGLFATSRAVEVTVGGCG